MKIKIPTAIFVVALMLSMLPHDIYQVGLAISSIMLCFWLGKCFKNRWAGIGVFAASSIILAQLSVLARRAFLDDGLTITAKNNPLGFIVGDIIHGLRRVIEMFVLSIIGFVKAIGWGEYQGIETLNYRFVMVGWLIVGMGIYLYLRSPDNEKEIVKSI